MRRRSLIKNIAGGMAHCFISRNNDIGGYWGIGVLRLRAQQLNTDRFELDLLAGAATPAHIDAQTCAQEFQRRLSAALERDGIAVSGLVSAQMLVDFKPEHVPRLHGLRSVAEGRFTCVATLTDDRGKLHEIAVGGICWPHNPANESKSTRAGPRH